MIDIMLQNQTNINNPLVKSASTNAFAVHSLLKLPASVIFKKSRERIFRSWLPTGDTALDEVQGLSYKSTALDPAVLSLKIKFMQRPVLYEVSKT
jgi:nucleolar pre-ribosomal-associated protein 2